MDPVNSVCQILGRLIFCNIAVVQVVNHLWNTSYIEPYARNTTGHCLYDGIG